MKTQYDIVLLPGDGIGMEVVAEAVKVLRAVENRLPDISFKFEEHEAGAAMYLKQGIPISEETFQRCREADAMLLGAMGLPDVRWPDGREVAPQLDLRERLDLFCGLRPLRLYHPADSPLKGAADAVIDMLLVRENTEGLFSSRRERTADAEGAHDMLRITRRGAERIFRAAFRQAQQRRSLVTLVDKANVLPSMVYFRAVFNEVAQEFPEVRTERIYVDAAALYLVQRPHIFDVLVTENMFGDILSDLAAALVGGMGMAPSADIGDKCAVFQPAHGSAPDIAGKGLANPIAAILSAAQMLDWLEHPPGAGLIRSAVEHVLADPAIRTPDLGGKLTTAEIGNRIAASIESHAQNH